MIAIAVVVYVVSVGADLASFGFQTWWTAKFVGALRLVGAYQNSGFNAPDTHVSLLSRVVANGHVFGVTYSSCSRPGCSARGTAVAAGALVSASGLAASQRRAPR